jgi:hypothetical protein
MAWVDKAMTARPETKTKPVFKNLIFIMVVL